MKKLLYVDDEKMNLLLFNALFQTEYNVLTAKSGEEGLDLVQNNSDIDFIISDMNMPGMNGMEFINEVKKVNDSIACYILSGYDMSEDICDALKTGFIVEYFRKPYKVETIEEALKKQA